MGDLLGGGRIEMPPVVIDSAPHDARHGYRFEPRFFFKECYLIRPQPELFSLLARHGYLPIQERVIRKVKNRMASSMAVLR